MNRNLSLVLILMIIFAASVAVRADAVKRDWFGSWTMNHDGFKGNLKIVELKADCAAPAWCDMAISYTDEQGKSFAGSIQKADDNWQHLIFYINFPNNRQKFDAYIFSWDKTKLAGTTIWNRRTFGFYAAKEDQK